MTVYLFKHPQKDITYKWDLNQKLLFINGNSRSLHLNHAHGILLHRFLEFKRLGNDGCSVSGETQSYTVRSYLSRILQALEAPTDMKYFFENIRGYGYRWLVPVEKVEKSHLELVDKILSEMDEVDHDNARRLVDIASLTGMTETIGAFLINKMECCENPLEREWIQTALDELMRRKAEQK